MRLLHLLQGSPEWIAARAKYNCASDAPAMMGCSPYKQRSQLLREKHTGVVPEVDTATHMRFENGHRSERLARPLAEEFIGAELFPVVGVSDDDTMLASMDGLTLDECTGFEHKAINADLRACMQHEDNSNTLPLMHRVQMEMQMLVSGCERVLFMASGWTADEELIEERHCWYSSDKELRQQIIDGWRQFRADLAAYVLPESVEPARAEPMDSLPAVSVRLDGALSVVGNLPTFAVALKAFIARIPARPATDNDFATTEAACKALKRAEEALDAAEAGALASITDVEAMRRAVADCRKLARDTRLAAEKLVDRRKLEIKESAVSAARTALERHVRSVNAELAPMLLLPQTVDFAGAIKGLRSISSMQDALDASLAAGKIAADSAARQIRANVATFAQQAEAEQARIAAAEQRAREQEAARIAAEAQEAAQQAQAAQQATSAPRSAPAVSPMTAPTVSPTVSPISAPPRADEPATLKLGDIADRLGFALRAEFVGNVLRIQPARTDGRALYYTESQFSQICQHLQSHVGAMAELYSGVAA